MDKYIDHWKTEHLDKFRKKVKFNGWRYRVYYSRKKTEKIGAIELREKVHR